MTGLKPYLGFIASLVVFALIVAYAAAIQWSPVFRTKSLQATWLAGMAALRVLGFLLGMFAWIGSHAMWLPHLLVLLWSKQAADATDACRCWLARYSKRRAFHRPQHAA